MRIDRETASALIWRHRALAVVLGSCLVVAGAGAQAGSSIAPLRDGAGPGEWVGDLKPIKSSDWNYERAAHLLERAGFGGTPEEIQRLADMTPEDAVRELVHYESKDNGHLRAFDGSGILRPGVIPTIEENTVRAALKEVEATGQALGLKPDYELEMPLQPIIDEAYYMIYASRLESRRLALWWAERMLQTNRPLEEKIAVFWHDHFALSYERVEDYRKMLQYLDVIWENSTGNFRDFVVAVAQNPAMLVYLDNGLNVKGHPNENFGREVLELFTMGEGNGYTETDIRELSRAFTGWTQDDLDFVIKADLHDTDNKTIFGRTANFDGVSGIDLIMEQPATAMYITEKLYKYFVADDIPEGVNEKLAKLFRESNYEIKPVLTTMFLSKDFYSPNAYATQVKTPIHLMVSTWRKLGLREVPGVPDFRATTTALGQELLAPPNVAGWEGGRSWINPATMLIRGNYVNDMFFAETEDRAGVQRPSAGSQIDRRRMSADQTASDSDSEMMTSAPASNAGAGAPAGTLMESESQMSAPVSTSPNNRYANRETYNLALGVRRGMIKADEVVKDAPQTRADPRLSQIVQEAGAQTTDQVVDYFVKRFLRIPLQDDARAALVRHLELVLESDVIDFSDDGTEQALRELTQLIMSTPEYQLS